MDPFIRMRGTAGSARRAPPGGPGARHEALVLRVLAAAVKPMGAYDIIPAVARLGEMSIYPNQVYRALGRLIGAGLVERVEISSAYLLRRGYRGVILVCTVCGAALQADAGPLHDALREAAERRRFNVERTIIEASGCCAACAASIDGIG
jgi:Fur family zinc uptake transcriptional regulator